MDFDDVIRAVDDMHLVRIYTRARLVLIVSVVGVVVTFALAVSTSLVWMVAVVAVGLLGALNTWVVSVAWDEAVRRKVAAGDG